MSPEARRTALGRRALAVWGPTKQRRACAGECSELAAELIRDSLGRHDEPALAEEVVGALQTIASVVLTIDPEIYAAAELAQAAKLEAKLEAAQAAPEPRPTGTALLMARIIWESLPPAQQSALRGATETNRGGLKLHWELRHATATALERKGLAEGITRRLTPPALAAREFGMRP